MKVIENMFLRWIIALFLPYNLFLAVLTPLTVYLTYIFLLPFSPIVNGNFIRMGNYNLEFIPACIAVTAYILFTILLLVTKDIDLKTGVKMWIFGFLLVLGANIVRILILIFLLIYGNIQTFFTLHLFFWKVVASVYVAFVWIFLVWKFKIKSIPVYSDFKYLISLMKK